ncbi:MAG: SH3 domain-containing protein [Clostridia bacterium]|nr:SH3 domain-containing protein [Clostridia bacterium]
MNNLNKILVIIFLYIAIPIITLAHPGNTAADGCHYCWTNCASWGYVYGTRHCHGGGSAYQAPSTPSCPSMSSYDSLSGDCKCYSGYIAQNGSCVSGNTYCQSHYAYGSTYDSYSNKCECPYGELVKNGSCISYDSYCHDTLGYGSKYNSLTDKCECKYGYLYDGDKCVTESEYCTDLLGFMSRYNSLTDKCECMSGYEYDGSICVYKKSITCPSNSYLGTDDKCYCNSGYHASGSICITYDQACRNQYGSNSYGDSDNCYCNSGYQWNPSQTSCVKITCPNNSSLIGNQCICNSGYLMENNACITYTQDCNNSFGEHVYGEKGNNNNSSCFCDNGYEWNFSKTACVKIVCQNNSSLINNQCVCDEDYMMKNNVCITYTQDCKNSFGEHVYGEKGNNNNSSCFCDNGYEWNSSKTACIQSQEKNVIVEKENTKNTTFNNDDGKEESAINNNPQISDEFKLAGNERIRECGGIDCKVIKFGSAGTATILEENGDWVKIKINDKGDIIEGWMSASLVPDNINITQIDNQNTTDNNNDDIQKENGIIKFFKNIFSFLGRK